MSAPTAQNTYYNASVDYRVGSPHLAHAELYDWLVSMVRTALADLIFASQPPTVLEVGAGHGGFTEPVLAAGAKVTAVEMAEASVARLNDRYGQNTNFTVVYAPEGSIQLDLNFSMGLAVSVLHHIPDYVRFLISLVSAITPGGTFVCIQDPLWYPRRKTTQRISRFCYLAWRLTRGDYATGLQTMLRRVRHVYDDSKPGDTVEYHVVRQGVDQEAVMRLLGDYFSEVSLLKYWSSQSRIAQAIGTRIGLANTFAVLATGRLTNPKVGFAP